MGTETPTKPVTKLDPEDALGGPLYLVASMLFAVPLVDFVLSVPPAEFGDVRWRFTAVGLLSEHMLLPVLGLALAFVISSLLKHYALQRALVIACLTIAVIFGLLSYQFLQDMREHRFSIAPDGQAAFNSASTRALVRLISTTVALAYLGWRARRMIPSPSRQRTPQKPVHVISK